MRKITLLFVLFMLLTGAVFSQTAWFYVTPKTYNGAFSTKGAFTAVWVEKANGEFVKTIEMKVDETGIDQLVSYFTEWISSIGWSQGEEIDGITGATSVSLTSYQYIWDCRDANGAFVPDGNYRIYYEFTEGKDPVDENITSRFTYVEFTKGPDNDTQEIPDSENFINTKVVYRANITDIDDVDQIEKKISIFPNPFKSTTEITINGMENQEKTIFVYDMTGKLVLSEKINEDRFVLDGSELYNGVYFVKVEGEDGVSNTQRIIKK